VQLSDEPSSGQDRQSGDSGLDDGIDSGVSTWPGTRPSAAPPTAGEGDGIPMAPPIGQRLRIAYQRRYETDYIASFWSAFGWGILTTGIFWFYMFFELIRRLKDHHNRRLDLLDAANAYAWEVAGQRGLQQELRPHFERTAAGLENLRLIGSKVKDPVIWLAILIGTFFATVAFLRIPYIGAINVAGIIVLFIVYCGLDRELIKHDVAEGDVEAELATIFSWLGQPLPQPDPSRIKGKHNYAARIIVSVVTVLIYTFWWTYNIMNEANRHFETNWEWEDSLAHAAQALAAGAGGPGRQQTGGDRTAVGG
jgi:hypothetical protein